MNAIEFFEELGVLNDVWWRPRQKGPVARIVRRQGATVAMQVALPFCGTWVKHSDMSVQDFLTHFKPLSRFR